MSFASRVCRSVRAYSVHCTDASDKLLIAGLQRDCMRTIIGAPKFVLDV